MSTIIYPFGVLPVETLAVDPDTANTYPATINQDCILFVKGTALAAASTVTLTARSNLRAGITVVIRWLSDGTARAVTIKPLIHANGQAFAGTLSKQSSVTLIYNGTSFIPISYLQSIDVA
ncbi:MAG: hypothetical protein EOM12_16520 [Verrucomicrobiae bacterium]|nr:hypothetical protein [Verrucomicrobiae bacterium]